MTKHICGRVGEHCARQVAERFNPEKTQAPPFIGQRHGSIGDEREVEGFFVCCGESACVPVRVLALYHQLNRIGAEIVRPLRASTRKYACCGLSNPKPFLKAYAL